MLATTRSIGIPNGPAAIPAAVNRPQSAACQAATRPEAKSPSKIRTGKAASNVESGQYPIGSYCCVHMASSLPCLSKTSMRDVPPYPPGPEDMTTAPAVVDPAKRPRPPRPNSGDTISHSEELSMVSAELGTYVATKGAVEQTSHVLAKELGPRGITVNVVSPGPTDTELFGQGKTEQDKQRFAQMAALGRLGQPEDIADVVALLVSVNANWITGQNIRANGGTI